MLDDNFQYALGPPESGFSIFLAERTKKVHFIRHAEVRLAVPRTLYFDDAIDGIYAMNAMGFHLCCFCKT